MSSSNDGSAFDLSDVSQLPHTPTSEGAAKRELADTGRVARFECGEGIGSTRATLGEAGIFQKARSMGNRANDLAPGVAERRCLLRKTDTEIHPGLKRMLPVLVKNRWMSWPLFLQSYVHYQRFTSNPTGGDWVEAKVRIVKNYRLSVCTIGAFIVNRSCSIHRYQLPRRNRWYAVEELGVADVLGLGACAEAQQMYRSYTQY